MPHALCTFTGGYLDGKSMRVEAGNDIVLVPPEALVALIAANATGLPPIIDATPYHGRDMAVYQRVGGSDGTVFAMVAKP